jgi:uncharacterized protein (DUF169 family)
VWDVRLRVTPLVNLGGKKNKGRVVESFYHLPLNLKKLYNKRMNKRNYQSFIKNLEINERILGIYFFKNLPKKFKHYKDTACTALARSFIRGEILLFDAQNYPQLCPGADFFLKLSNTDKKEALKIYVEIERVFKNKKICNEFLKTIPQFPSALKNRHVVIKPFKAADRPGVICLLVNPAQAGRIIGLLNYQKFEKIVLIPNQPTCLSFFAPLVTKRPHLNFMDYYDRYYQGKVNKKLIWSEEKMILSLNFKQFEQIINNLNNSPQGTYKPTLKPKYIDPII